MVEFRFEKMEVWQLAIEFANAIYELTQQFPESERYGLISQLRRAAVSIPANIAEGSGRWSSRDNLRFIEISYGSLMEVISHVEIACRREFMNSAQRSQIRLTADNLARQLSGFANHLRKEST